MLLFPNFTNINLIMDKSAMSALSELPCLLSLLEQKQSRSLIRIESAQADLFIKSLLLNEERLTHDSQAKKVAWFSHASKDNSKNENSFIDHFELNQGAQILGREFDCLVFDYSSLTPEATNSFNANSFNAACGTLKAGGIVFLINLDHLSESLSKTWLLNALSDWPLLCGDTPQDADVLAKHTNELSKIEYKASVKWQEGKTLDQITAIDGVKRVMSGHRKRPLLLTAHRGRGKSSALGFAVAQLLASTFENSTNSVTKKALNKQPLTILITAPSKQSIQPVFEHALSELNSLIQASSIQTSLKQQIRKHDQEVILSQDKTSLTLPNGSSLTFIAPDALLQQLPTADLLLVDEAAALPLPCLLSLLEHYHRMALSTTLHGYEGSGLGVVHKLTKWLDEHRQGWQQINLQQPIRWQQNDPLEQWLFDTFLLAPNALNSLADSFSHLNKIESNQIAPDLIKPDLIKPETNCQLVKIDKNQLAQNPQALISMVNLLINAHYQTTPNDLWQWLDDDNIHLYQLFLNSPDKPLIGCVVVNLEGGLSPDLTHEIMIGKRRPKGHLVPVQLTQHLACSQAATQTSARIMRIAIHPELQAKGFGTQALQLINNQYQTQGNIDYLSVSFGATPELVKFWSHDYSCVRLGNSRDHVSGCFSAVMICPLSESARDWTHKLESDFRDDFQLSLSTVHQSLSVELVCVLLQITADLDNKGLSQINGSQLTIDPRLSFYAQGGSQFESIHKPFAEFLWDLLSRNNSILVENSLKNGNQIVDLLIQLALQNQQWNTVSTKGRKSLEAEIRQWLCKELAIK